MDKKSKVFFGVLLALILISVGFTYRRTMMLRDYPVIVNPKDGG